MLESWNYLISIVHREGPLRLQKWLLCAGTGVISESHCMWLTPLPKINSYGIFLVNTIYMIPFLHQYLATCRIINNEPMIAGCSFGACRMRYHWLLTMLEHSGNIYSDFGHFLFVVNWNLQLENSYVTDSTLIFIHCNTAQAY